MILGRRNNTGITSQEEIRGKALLFAGIMAMEKRLWYMLTHGSHILFYEALRNVMLFCLQKGALSLRLLTVNSNTIFPYYVRTVTMTGYRYNSLLDKWMKSK